MVSSIARVGAAALLLASSAVASPIAEEASCNCGPESKPTVRYIVVEMPPQNTTAAPVAAEKLEVEADAAAAAQVAAPVVEATAVNTTAVFAPVAAPNVDRSSPDNYVPAANISLWYGGAAAAAATPKASSSNTSSFGASDVEATKSANRGTINMNLNMNSAAVILEDIEAVDQVLCQDDMVVVTFDDATGFDWALKSWSAQKDLVLVTNHLGNCDAENERGFFKGSEITSNKDGLAITVATSKADITSVAESLQMTFSSIPAGTVQKRLALDPSATIAFSDGIGGPMTIYSYPPYLNITADQAEFATNVTFSGYLKYNFWGFKLEDLTFDLDMAFSADAAVSAEVGAAYQKDFTYTPDDLTYSLVEVPGVISLGPGVGFGIGLNLNTSGGVDVGAGLGISIPDGNVHIDFLNQNNSAQTGWTPEYTNWANISEKAAVTADVSASVTVQLAIKLLGGLLDLSSGLTAKPTLNNDFVLAATQGVSGDGVSLPSDNSTCDGGVSVKSDLSFDLTGFATKYWSGSLYSVQTALADACYVFQH